MVHGGFLADVWVQLLEFRVKLPIPDDLCGPNKIIRARLDVVSVSGRVQVRLMNASAHLPPTQIHSLLTCLHLVRCRSPVSVSNDAADCCGSGLGK